MSKSARSGLIAVSSSVSLRVFLSLLALIFMFCASGAASAQEFNLSNGAVTIDTNGSYVITQSDPATDTQNVITVNSGVTADITLAGVYVTGPSNTAALSIMDGAAVTLRMAEDSVNRLTGVSYAAGISVRENSSLVIEGPGELIATGGVSSGINSGGAGIGSNYPGSGSSYATAGSITIESGIITAACGGNYGAGIGGGRNGNHSEITINGGVVAATGGSSGGSGIGSGYNGKLIDGGSITINGGHVTARAGSGNAYATHGAAIGGGHNSSGGEITITGGSVTALPGAYTRTYSPSWCAIGVGIGGGRNGGAGDIKITGGSVTAVGGKYQDQNSIGTVSASGECDGIGGGAEGGNLTIGDGSAGPFIYASSTRIEPVFNSGILILGDGSVDGSVEFEGDSVTLTANAVLPEGVVLVVADGKTLTISDGVDLTISKNAVLDNIGAVFNYGRIINVGTITNQPDIQGGGEVRNITPPGAPSVDNESTAVGDSFVDVYFTPGGDGNGMDISYAVRCYGIGGSEELVKTVTERTIPIRVGGLTEGVTYYFTVTASNEAGEGAESEPSWLFVPGTDGVTYVAELTPEYLTWRREAGYGEAGPLEVAVKNVGTGALSGIAASLDKGAESPFEITELPDATLAPMIPGSSNNVTLLKARPKTGLAIGTYTDKLTVNASGADPAYAELTFTVTAQGNVEQVPDNYMTVVWTNYDYKRLAVGDKTELWARAASNGKELYNYSVKFERESGGSVTVTDSLESGREALIEAVSPGVSVVKVTYAGAPDINAAYVVYDVAGADDEADVDISSSLIDIREMKDLYEDTTSAQVNGKSGDVSTYNTVYFTNGDTTQYTFSVGVDTGSTVAVSVNGAAGESKSVAAGVSSDFTVELANRGNIIEITAATPDGKSKSLYKVLDARKIEINVDNVSRPGKDYIVAGDEVKISFRGIELPLFKIDGIYNPSMPMGEYDGQLSYLSYHNDHFGTVKGSGGQYNLATNNAISLTPDEPGEFSFEGGKIVEHWWGRVIGFDKFLRDEGGQMAGGSGNATLNEAEFSSLPGFVLTVLAEAPADDDDTGDPGSTDPGNTDPGNTDPGNTDPGDTDPGSTDPGDTDPGNTDPGNTDPGDTDPGNTDPGNTDPGDNEPGGNDPGGNNPGVNEPGIETDDGVRIAAAAPFTPADSDVEAPSAVSAFTVGDILDIADLPGLAGLPPDALDQMAFSARADGSGVLVADAGAVISGLNPGDAAEIDTAGKTIPLPVFKAEVADGKTALVAMGIDLDGLAGERIGNLALLKLRADGTTERLDPAASPSGISHGQYAWTDGMGGAVSPEAVITPGGEYVLSVAVKDDSKLDWDPTPGSVVDPLALAKVKAANDPGTPGEPGEPGGTDDPGTPGGQDNLGGGEGAIPGGSSGGCDAGAGGLLATGVFAPFALAAWRRKAA